jgi:hypothetical protein
MALVGIQEATGIRRETISGYLKAAGIALRSRRRPGKSKAKPGRSSAPRLRKKTRRVEMNDSGGAGVQSTVNGEP